MRFSTDFKLTAGLLILALAVGGAGLAFPLLQMLLGLFAVAVGAYFAWTPQARMSSFARIALGLVAAMLALIVLQLVPLPPQFWQALPGREVAVQLDRALGTSTWRPWTLDVEATIRSLLVLIPAVVLFVGCLRLRTPDRLRLPWIIVAFALIGAILGIIQLATAGGLTPYPSAHLGYPIGLFVNRNHNAALLLVSIPLVAALGAVQIARGRSAATIIALAAMAVFAIVVLATTSRMALVLLPIAVVGALLLLFFSGSLWRIALPSVLALVGLAVVIVAGGGFNRTLTRFSSLHDSRFDYWTDVYWALGHYGIAGTGFGTFIPVYKSAESLGAVGSSILNHAHNEYIELLLEGGVQTIVLLAIFVGFMVYCGVKLVRSNPKMERASISFAAATGILIFLLFSLVDYPLRMPALSCVFAVFCSLLLPRVHAPTKRAVVAVEPSSVASASTSWHAHARPARLAVLVLLAVSAVVIVQAALSSKQLLAQRGAEALRLAPWSTEANEQAATQALLQGSADDALRYADAATDLSPISAPAIRTIGLFELNRGASRKGNRLMELAAGLGWRDVLTQLWTIDAAKRSGETDKAVERANSMFQQQLFQPALVTLLQPPVSAELMSAFVADLAYRHSWRSGLLRSGGDLPQPTLDTFEHVLIQLGSTDAPPTIHEAGSLVDRLAQSGDFDEARRVWAAIHGSALVLNGDFEAVDSGDPNRPISWNISDEDAAAIDVGRPEVGDNSRALRLYGTHSAEGLISQRLMLTPGSYVLTFRAYENPPSGSMVRWELRCSTSGASSSGDSILSGSSWQQFNLDLTVPNQNCPVQRLALKRPSDIHPHELWIDDVELKPAAR